MNFLYGTEKRQSNHFGKWSDTNIRVNKCGVTVS